MGNPPIPVEEVERLAELRALEILDTPPEERFDRVTRLAQKVFDVPIALISLVAENRQWFKSRVGLEVKETHRELSFCAHAITGDEILHVTDASADKRFQDNPLVTADPNIRFYAGCPIASPNGYKLGTLCVIDRHPRQMSEEDLQILHDLAAIVEEELAAIYLATTDRLTGLRNRRGFLLVSHQVLRFSKRMDELACLVFVDLDGLKQINDEFGHDTGDRALVHTAELLNKSFRESDVIARLAGDEFCVLLSGASALNAAPAIERLQRNIQSHNETYASGPPLALSLGMAESTPSSDETLDELVKRADKKMYAHKRSKLK